MTRDVEWSSYRDAPRILHAPPGPRSRELLAEQARLETEAVSYPRHFPIAIASAQGATIEDVDGNRFIDWVAGISVLNLGHRHPRLEEALHAQAGKIWHALELPTEARIEFLRELRAHLPGALKNHAKILFTVTGGDAVETAVSLADFAQGRTGTVAFSGAYHGVHGGAVNLTSGRRYHRTTSFHGGSIVRVPYPDPYHPVLGADAGAAGTIRYLEHLVTDPHSGIDQISSVLVEPVLGEGGYVVPPADFLPSLREFCDRHHILLIADEVQTGLGRTGRFWAVEHSGVTPDILCIAKSIGGGIPLSLVAYREDLAPELPPGFHLGTYRGNPLALAVGTEVLRILAGTDVIERTRTRGARLLERFRSISSSHPAMGDVRGLGFMIGTEFVRDARTRSPWTEGAKSVRAGMLGRGVLMHTAGSYDQVLRFMAPLTIEDELLERGTEIFEQAIGDLDRQPPATASTPPESSPSPPPAHARRPAGPLPHPTASGAAIRRINRRRSSPR
ncbi:MAG: aspartate aminotransferase family protein [Thermoplasmata archaeon]|nr:aspartate aminotransferase family protein [Thermoplasmata archaeon]